ncbi:MAG TPA: threonine synthase [Chthoniobacterales bacterium]
MSFVTHLECSLCSRILPADKLQTVCGHCGKPLFARYDLARVKSAVRREDLTSREPTLWRYREILPLPFRTEPVSLGEGWTPLLPVRRFASVHGSKAVFLKDEASNPTGSFKARGMSLAVSMASWLGARKLAAPSAGNAAGALAAYAARAGSEAHLFVPRDTPLVNVTESRAAGANVQLIDGLITDCAAEVARRAAEEGWFDVSTLKEPYRVEGKKTLGYELAEQLGWHLPDAILYPTGGGTGVIGMWKAFEEMEALGWVSSKRPRLIGVQASGCQPLVRAFERHEPFATEHAGAQTLASGLRVPRALGDFLILRAVRASGGLMLAVTDEEMAAGVYRLGELEGVFACPEAGACLAAFGTLRKAGAIGADETVVIFNTATGTKYPEFFEYYPPPNRL